MFDTEQRLSVDASIFQYPHCTSGQRQPGERIVNLWPLMEIITSL